MGFNYLLMERKLNFPSQLASDFCTKQEICGLRWRTKSSLQECVWTWLKEERWEERGRPAEYRDQRTLFWAELLRTGFSCFTIITKELTQWTSLTWHWRSRHLCCASVGSPGGSWSMTWYPVTGSPPQSIVSFKIFSRRIISSWMRH